MQVNLIQIKERTIREAHIEISEGRLSAIRLVGPENNALPYMLPGFVDAHVHVESSMLTPAQFARLAVVHGTVATVSDPHEIANVCGMQGVEFMIQDGKRTPFKFCFGAPSCVPATTFETAGAVLDADDIQTLLEKDEIGYLAEVMNFPGVLHGDPDMMQKIAWAKHYNKPIDGHAPGLRGEAAKAYASHGIDTDHECFTYEEAREKIDYGVNILIREGSAARNFDALIPLLAEFPEKIMFCSDDKHPDNLVEGHINLLVKRALGLGHNLWNVLQAACINPVAHYKLAVGQCQPGDAADFILIDNPTNFNILETWLDGKVVAAHGVSNLPDLSSPHINRFDCREKTAAAFQCNSGEASSTIRVIEALEGQLITRELLTDLPSVDGNLRSDVASDTLKMVVVNRYSDAPPAISFVRNFGLKQGAIASSVAHDSHNIIAVGCTDEAITEAVNLVIGAKGGVAAASETEKHLLALPIGGLMSDVDGYTVAKQYTAIDDFTKQTLGATLKSPFMTLSFMALLVIPSLKISDKGLFNGDTFEFASLNAK